MTDVAQCACLRVEYKATQHDNGTVTGRWLCAYGGDHEFVQIGQLRAALARAERAEALVRECHSVLEENRPFVNATRGLDLLARIAELEKP